MSASVSCTTPNLHTRQPWGYVAWHEWAEKMSRTHVQVECPGCGRLMIWKRSKTALAGRRSS